MNDKNPIEDLKAIRKMMESSSKFLSLSGLSGIFAGLTAIVGAYFAHLEIKHWNLLMPHYYLQGRGQEGYETLSLRLLLIALIILVIALSFGVFFTWLKARKLDKSIWTPLSMRLVISIMIPLGFGGMFCIGLYVQGYPELIAPAMLIFYGFSLLNGSKYVHNDIKFLALCEMALGVISLLDLNKGIMYWTIGFGILHIFYGAIMYFKYDRK
ncbi:hypothetical protein [Crocinitomix algicola]|uniref:hypothetical protein n=1 Tax=Crocinitomix algicola TaxID=1740263 RepID=UPI00082AB47F|nr:hypothetical protein [Crocinitomix algicola]